MKLKNLASSLVRLGSRKESNNEKIFNWIWSKKQQEEYSFEPVWTPREINDQKYEARQRRERYLAAKYLSDN